MKSKQIGDAAERLFQKALAASASGDVVQAERLYRLAIGMVAGRSEPRHNLGALLRSLGRLEEARDLLACWCASRIWPKLVMPSAWC